VGHHAEVVAPSRTATGAVHGIGQLGVGVDQQQRQQVVAIGDVPIHRRRHHAQVARHRAKRQGRRALGGQVPAPDLEDLRFDAVPGLLTLAHATV
jgi:hypothetical protein